MPSAIIETNKDREYLKVICDILERELSLGSVSTKPEDKRVFVYNQNFTLPAYDDMFIVVGCGGEKVISCQSYFDSASDKEIQEIVVQEEITLDIMSRNNEARLRRSEVFLALASQYSQAQQELNGFRIFSYPTMFADVSEAEGAGRLNRYRTSIIIHVKYRKEKSIDYFTQFDYTTVYD